MAEEANVECGCKSPLTEVHSKSNGRRGQIGWKNLKQNFKAHHRDSSESRQWAFSITNIHVHGACLAPELIDQFIEVVTPIADYSYRWKLNTGCKKSKEERADLMAVSEKPILTFTIDFETAKRYREANKMPHQFRRAAWTDLTVEVYL